VTVKKTILAALVSVLLIAAAHGEEPSPIHADQPDSRFLKDFANYALIVGVDPRVAVADARTIFAETQKPWTETIDENGTVDRPGKWVGVVRHTKSGAIRRLGEADWVEWLTVCRDFRDKNDGINCEIQLTSH
jgi:hypothetical protein